MKLTPSDEAFLVNQIRLGQALIVLGAGASVGSTNRYGKPIKTGKELAMVLSTAAGLPFNDESLPMVYEAVRGTRLSDVKIRTILQNEFCNTSPSEELTSLFSVCWRRLYTFNIDDTIQNLHGLKSSQRRKYYNGLIDRVAEYDGPLNLQIIYLHGQADKPEHGFIFSENDYARGSTNDHLYWYARAGQDYLECPVFIGSRLDEPILWAQIERAKRTENSAAGLGFVVTPGSITEIQAQSLRNKGLVHIQATLKEFIGWLVQKFPSRLSPADIVKATSIDSKDLQDLKPDDINAAHYLRPIQLGEVRKKLSANSSAVLSHKARQFLQGFPPTWELAASDIPVHLENGDHLYADLCAALKENRQLFVVTGQSGSGKTTALLMALLRYLETGTRKLYEVTGDVRSVRHIFSVLKKLGDPCIVYIGDLFLYGDPLSDDLDQLKGSQITVVSSARLGEWNEHFVRHLGRFGNPFVFNRFTKNDYQPLLDRLNRYVPAPAFKKLSTEEQLKKLATSRSQLLIALHDATHSENFAEVITAEFEKLPDEDTKRLCLIAGVATIARVGIGLDMASVVYGAHSQRALKSALDALDGVVELTSQNRLFARHELYIRHIIENVISFDEFVAAVSGILSAYTKFEIPVIRRINRTDGYLFKFLLNNDFIYQVASLHREREGGRKIYQLFEVEFQLDGQFWLQYALYLLKLDDYDESLRMLIRSIEAYPENAFAQHALAHLQLRIASHRRIFDSATEKMVLEAVKSLELLNARGSLVTDQYPLVTLAMGHVGALAVHKQDKEALAFAKKYHQMLREMGKKISNEAITRAEEAMLRYVTLGEIPGKLFGPASPRVNSRSRKK